VHHEARRQGFVKAGSPMLLALPAGSVSRVAFPVVVEPTF